MNAFKIRTHDIDVVYDPNSGCISYTTFSSNIDKNLSYEDAKGQIEEYLGSQSQYEVKERLIQTIKDMNFNVSDDVVSFTRNRVVHSFTIHSQQDYDNFIKEYNKN